MVSWDWINGNVDDLCCMWCAHRRSARYPLGLLSFKDEKKWFQMDIMSYTYIFPITVILEVALVTYLFSHSKLFLISRETHRKGYNVLSHISEISSHIITYLEELNYKWESINMCWTETGQLLLGFVNLSMVWRTSVNYTLHRQQQVRFFCAVRCAGIWERYTDAISQDSFDMM